MRKMRFYLCLLLACLCLFSCTGGATDQAQSPFAPPLTEPAENALTAAHEPIPVPPQSITLSPESVALYVGEKKALSLRILPENADEHAPIYESSDDAVCTVDENGTVTARGVGECTVTVRLKDTALKKEARVTVKQKHPSPTVGDSTAQECTYIDGILIVNKTYPLPKSYAPHEDKTAVSALYGMFKAAKKEGLSLFVKSGYRSYLDQSIIYRGYVERDGQAAADRYSARPGHSEHQSGLAFDLNSTSSSFADTPEGIWLKDNCHKYGFIIRYPEGKEHLTGYMYEPWHVRYLGVEKATAVYESGLCLEEYLGITSAYES